jgi:hypothetical protein
MGVRNHLHISRIATVQEAAWGTQELLWISWWIVPIPWQEEDPLSSHAFQWMRIMILNWDKREDCSFLGRVSVYFGEQLWTFRRDPLPPSSKKETKGGKFLHKITPIYKTTWPHIPEDINFPVTTARVSVDTFTIRKASGSTERLAYARGGSRMLQMSPYYGKEISLRNSCTLLDDLNARSVRFRWYLLNQWYSLETQALGWTSTCNSCWNFNWKCTINYNVRKIHKIEVNIDK